MSWIQVLALGSCIQLLRSGPKAGNIATAAAWLGSGWHEVTHVAGETCRTLYRQWGVWGRLHELGGRLLSMLPRVSTGETVQQHAHIFPQNQPSRSGVCLKQGS